MQWHRASGFPVWFTMDNLRFFYITQHAPFAAPITQDIQELLCFGMIITQNHDVVRIHKQRNTCMSIGPNLCFIVCCNSVPPEKIHVLFLILLPQRSGYGDMVIIFFFKEIYMCYEIGTELFPDWPTRKLHHRQSILHGKDEDVPFLFDCVHARLNLEDIPTGNCVFLN